MRPHISYSELSEFANSCQHRWKLNYLENRRAEIFSIHFDFGTAIHEALERHFTRKDPVSIDEAVKIFEDKLKELHSANGTKYKDLLSEDDIQEMIKSGDRILRSLTKVEELKDVEVVHNEYPLLEQIDRDDGVDIKFKGFIDLVIKTKAKNGDVVLYVCDFKTCSWGWNVETRQDKWKHFQVFLYKYFLCKKFNIDPKYVRTAFILLKKRPPSGVLPIEFFPVSAGPVSVQRAVDMLNRTLSEMNDRIKNDNFEKNRKMCTDSFGNVCPFFKTELCQ